MSPLNAASCTTTYLERQNVMVQTREYYLKNHYLTFMSKVKVPGRSLWYTTPPYGHAPIPNIIDLSKKKPLFDLEVKGQGPTQVIMVCNTPPYGHAPIPNIIDLSQKKQLFDSKVKGQIKVIMVCDTPPYGHAPTYQISLTSRKK